MPPTLHWLDVEDIALRLHEEHPTRDPLAVRFTELRQMVEALPDFKAQPGHPPNEKILETIQAMWHEEVTDSGGEDDDED